MIILKKYNHICLYCNHQQQRTQKQRLLPDAQIQGLPCTGWHCAASHTQAAGAELAILSSQGWRCTSLSEWDSAQRVNTVNFLYIKWLRSKTTGRAASHTQAAGAELAILSGDGWRCTPLTEWDSTQSRNNEFHALPIKSRHQWALHYSCRNIQRLLCAHIFVYAAITCYPLPSNQLALNIVTLCIIPAPPTNNSRTWRIIPVLFPTARP